MKRKKKFNLKGLSKKSVWTDFLAALLMSPTNKPYDNEQIQILYDIQEFIPSHQVEEIDH